jgi:hypothetical protein
MLLADRGRGRRFAQDWLAPDSPAGTASGVEVAAARARRLQRSRLFRKSRTSTLNLRISRCLAATRLFHFSRLRASKRSERAGELVD